MASQTIIPATQYTPVPPPEQRFSPSSFAWLKKFKKPQPLPIKRQLPSGDMEELLRLWESTERMVESERYPDQDDFENAERQMGHVLHSGELVKRILRLNGNLIVEDSNSMKGCAGFYWTDGTEKKWTNASFTKGWVPEFTIMKSDTAGRPVHYPTYGWRTVLVRLLKFRAITWQDVLTTFGDVKHSDTRGKHWELNIRHFRS